MTLTKNRAADLRATYPKWVIWQSGPGRWWATREGAVSLAQRDRGVVASLDADQIEELAKLVEEQERMREEAP